MNNSLKRREFILRTAKAGLAGCALMAGAKMFGAENLNLRKFTEKPNPKLLNYCGYTCPADCRLKKATLENDLELKKQAYKDWRIEEKYGIAFDPDKVTCYGCKVSDDKVAFVVEKCTVRNCAIDKGYDSCIQCNQLAACDKEIWKNFPDFHKMMIELQKQYNEA
jgi:hypothetical protein